jgi:hypothetical protein
MSGVKGRSGRKKEYTPDVKPVSTRVPADEWEAIDQARQRTQKKRRMVRLSMTDFVLICIREHESMKG